MTEREMIKDSTHDEAHITTMENDVAVMQSEDEINVNLRAVGGYLSRLRELWLEHYGRGFTQKEVAERAGTSASSIWRIEKGTRIAEWPSMFRLIQLLQGDFGHIAFLMEKMDATPEEGKELARQRWLKLSSPQQAAEQIPSDVSEEEIARAIVQSVSRDALTSLVIQLAQDPKTAGISRHIITML